jgi:hypothetical protein
MEHTEQSKEEVIDKILSFSYIELENWVRSRLHGDDEYFSIYEGHETNLRGFLADAFHHIKNKTFRDNFLEILNDLVSELRKYSPKEIEQDKDYIYELLTLCGSIKKFKDAATLYKLAKSGKFKPYKLRDTDLHLVLLTTLLSYRLGGNYRFWIEQMQDDSNKYYTNAAFYALLKQGFRLDILFDHIEKFIDRFKGGIELVFGIEALFDYHEPKKIYSMFNKIESRLSKEQKEAVNNAFKEAGYDPVYEPDAAAEKELKYIPAPPQLQYVRAPTPEYDALATLKESSAEIFKLMGFEVELNRKIADHTIDLFAKRKKSFITSYECWICKCDTTNRNVSKKIVDDFADVWEPVKKELQNQTNDDCQPMIISGKGFTKTAIEAAKTQKIALKTYNQLLSDLNTFYSHQKPLIQDLDALISR